MTQSRRRVIFECLTEYIDESLNLWAGIFGPDLEQAWSNSEAALDRIVTTAKNVLDMGDRRKGHCLLFVRDPLSDRLVLKHSTNRRLAPGKNLPPPSYLRFKSENYDSENRQCFYNLCDRLTPDTEKKSDEARRTRGLTGWVCVTGHPLRVNSERSRSRLEDIPQDNPEAEEECDLYGTPLWGNRISEHPLRQGDRWSKRYLAAPIKSVTDETITVGVLRYTCYLKGAELTSLDVQFLECMAQIAGAVINLGRIRSIAERESRLSDELSAFEAFGDLRRFLRFISESLRSEVSSLYVRVNLKGRPVLKLFDAHGISGRVGDLRRMRRIRDYTYRATGKRGLTWELQKTGRNGPKVYESVLDSSNWAGKNTAVFYENVLVNLGLRDISEKLRKRAYHKGLLETYSIKLVGLALEENEQVVGVLKVEFPSAFDSSEHYNPRDQEFLVKCAKVLSKELASYQEFVSGKWFESAGKDQVPEFVRMVNQLIRVQLIGKTESPAFWDKLEKYVKQHKNEITAANESLFRSLPRAEGRRFARTIWQMQRFVPDWLKAVLLSELLRSWTR